jgi:hypothetical protein
MMIATKVPAMHQMGNYQLVIELPVLIKLAGHFP